LLLLATNVVQAFDQDTMLIDEQPLDACIIKKWVILYFGGISFLAGIMTTVCCITFAKAIVAWWRYRSRQRRRISPQSPIPMQMVELQNFENQNFELKQHLL
jgi:hypothetical protein